MKTWSLMAVCAALNCAIAVDSGDNGLPTQSASAPTSVTNVLAIRSWAPDLSEVVRLELRFWAVMPPMRF